MRLTLMGVDEFGLIVKGDQDYAEEFSIDPREAWDTIRTLQDGLFQWRKLTHKNIDEGNPT